MQGVENISALMDGEMGDDEAAKAIAHLKQDAARLGAWHTYHVIGEAMRGEHAGAGLSPGFSQRLSERLAQEPTVLAPRVRLPKTLQTYALSAAASVAAFAAVGWVAINMTGPDTAPGTVAQTPAATQSAAAPAASQTTLAPVAAAPAVAPGIEPVAAAPEHVHEYLLAHQGISPSTAIQGVAPYIRTVSSMSDARAVR